MGRRRLYTIDGALRVVPRRHKEAREKLDDLSEYIRATSVKLEKVVADDDLDALGVMMALFKTIRERESGPLAAF